MAGLVVLLCPERSGSTLLASMLGANPGVLAPPELFLLRYGDYDTWRRAKPAAFASLAWLMEKLGEPSSTLAVDARLAGWSTSAVVSFLLERAGPGRFLVDKTPAYGRERPALERAVAFSPRFVWLVRHPLGVAGSWMDRRRARRWEFAGAAGRSAARRLASSRAMAASWLAARLDERAARAGIERWRLVHSEVSRLASALPASRLRRVDYEDLVVRPEQTLAGLCTWLEVPFDRAMLEPWKHLPGALARGVGDELVRRHDSVRADRATAWRGRVDEGLLDQDTRELMRSLGLAP